MTDMPRGVVPPGTYAKGGRSPIVYAWLCPVCAGYAPMSDENDKYQPGQCDGCRATSRELHRFQAMIMSAANGGCFCDTHGPQVTGDLPTRQSADQLMLEVLTRPRRPEVPDA
jgi:hypothetical protein